MHYSGAGYFTGVNVIDRADRRGCEYEVMPRLHWQTSVNGALQSALLTLLCDASQVVTS